MISVLMRDKNTIQRPDIHIQHCEFLSDAARTDACINEQPCAIHFNIGRIPLASTCEY